MADLTAAARREWETPATWVDALLTAEVQVYAGQMVVWSATNAKQVRDIPTAAATGFAGIALNNAAAGEQVSVRVRGVLYLSTTAINAALTDVGITVEAETTAAGDNDPETGIVAVGDMPVGNIVRVDATGAGTSKIAILIGGDGWR